MFTQTPKDSEFFDLDDFVNENISTLRELYEQSSAYLEGAYFGDDLTMQIAILIAASVYAGKPTLEIPIEVEPEDAEAVCEFACRLFVVATLFEMESKGCVVHKRDGWMVTAQGHKHVEGMAA